MLLEDGFWRVRHMVKMDAEPFQKRHRKTNTHLHGKQKKILQNKIIPSKESIIPKNSAWDTFGDYSIRILLQKILISLNKPQHYKYLFNI
jgi:hypothetical protein